MEEPFDGGVKPLFFFPEQPTQTLTARDGKTYQARDARLQLADVPFAPLRLRFPDIADIPTRFRDLVETYCEVFKRDANEPAVVQLLDHPPRLVVNGLTTELESERQLLVWQFLLEANREEWVQKDQAEALEIFKAWQGHAPELNRVRPALRKTVEQLHEKHKAKPGPTWVGQATSDDIKRPLSFARRKLEKDGSRWQPPKRDLRLPPFRWVRSS